jgi:hypothetical protein
MGERGRRAASLLALFVALALLGAPLNATRPPLDATRVATSTPSAPAAPSSAVAHFTDLPTAVEAGALGAGWPIIAARSAAEHRSLRVPAAVLAAPAARIAPRAADDGPPAALTGPLGASRNSWWGRAPPRA